jgi:serine/threonine protein kinase
LTYDGRAQISDFGISRMFENETDDDILLTDSSPAFTPPEACFPSSTKVKGKALDIWCLGVTLFCLAHGYPPFEEVHVLDLYKKIMHQEPCIAPAISMPLKELILGMLTKSPKERMKLHSIKQDPWVTMHGIDPMMPSEQNCVFQGVTREEVENAVVRGGLIGRIMSKLRTTTDRLWKPNVVPLSMGLESPDELQSVPETEFKLIVTPPIDSAWSLDTIKI